MNKQMKTTISILIIVVVVIILSALSIIFMINNKKDREVIVNLNGEELTEIDGEKLDLNVDRVFTIYTDDTKTDYNTFEIKDKSIKCIDSTCEDQVCKRFGAVDGSRDADCIICAPHKLIIYFSK